MAADTRALIGENAEKVESRSLCFERFAAPQKKDDERTSFFRTAIKRKAIPAKAHSWTTSLSSMVANHGGQLFYSQLQSRMMVNMAGGVMENAGLCLDRFGLPYLPGSAVKGCTRRAVLAALEQWCSAGGLPENRPISGDNPFAQICSRFERPAQLLACIARIFGWGKQEWESQSDWAWAIGADRWVSIISETRSVMMEPVPPSCAGTISFLPGYPVDIGNQADQQDMKTKSPELGLLELDIIACHHPEYYAGKKPVATDTEDPKPVTFPAVASGHVFAFALLALRGATSEDLDTARASLAVGLGTFGIGAKTNAGYGWFDSTDGIHQAVQKAMTRRKDRLEAEERRRLEEERVQAEENRRREEAEQDRAAMANLTSDQREDYLLDKCNDDEFRGRLNSFAGREEAEKRAIVRALRKDPNETGSRRRFWDDLKRKATRGGPPAKLENAIRAMSKQMYPETGKMP